MKQQILSNDQRREMMRAEISRLVHTFPPGWQDWSWDRTHRFMSNVRRFMEMKPRARIQRMADLAALIAVDYDVPIESIDPEGATP